MGLLPTGVPKWRRLPQPAPSGKPPPSPGTSGRHIQLAPGVEWRYEYVSDSLWGATLFFYFHTGGSALTAAQLKVVRESLVPLLAQPLSYAELYGLADRTGSRQVNHKVSGDRLRNFQAACQSAGAPPAKVNGSQHKYFGEDYAESYGVRDDSSIQDYRVVLAYVWSNYTASRRIFADKNFIRYARSTPQP